MELMLNFRRPYLSGSFKEFWKRWHISLSSWFMDYVYIPLGGSRRGAARRVFNVFVVFLLSGLWHGASWTFVAWGFCCALFMVVLDKPLSRTSRIPGFNQAVVFVLWALSLILFRASSFGNAAQVFSALGFGNAKAVFSFGLGSSEFIFACALIVLLALQECICERRGERMRMKFLSSPAWVRVLCAAAVLLIIVFLGRYGIGSESKFIYFQF
jgi:D-alanyl-lipoteichoic acid acyltransferase DltB (MBOAT superfamily)